MFEVCGCSGFKGGTENTCGPGSGAPNTFFHYMIAMLKIKFLQRLPFKNNQYYSKRLKKLSNTSPQTCDKLSKIFPKVPHNLSTIYEKPPQNLLHTTNQSSFQTKMGNCRACVDLLWMTSGRVLLTSGNVLAPIS